MPYASLPYAGFARTIITPSQDQIGVPFLHGNDRYQVVVCADSGTGSSVPSWRYWNASGAPWGEVIALDQNSPQFYATDENGLAVQAEIEFPLREIKTNQNLLVSGVLVEFTPQPLALEPGIDPMAAVTFTVRVEGYGLPDFERTDSGRKTGVVVSEPLTFTETIVLEPSDPWPNTRTEFLPCRLNVRLRAARIVITEMSLCEINRVTLMGVVGPQRNV